MSDPARYVARMLGVRDRMSEPGDVVEVHHCVGGYLLPEGLPEHTRVTLLDFSTGYWNVQDASGKIFRISMCRCDKPMDVWWDGQWVDYLTHPCGQKAFANWMDHERAEQEEGRWREFVR